MIIFFGGLMFKQRNRYYNKLLNKYMSENQSIEFKETWKDEYLKWICGFVNANGLSLFIGKNDKGEIVPTENAIRVIGFSRLST